MKSIIQFALDIVLEKVSFGSKYQIRFILIDILISIVKLIDIFLVWILDNDSLRMTDMLTSRETVITTMNNKFGNHS